MWQAIACAVEFDNQHMGIYAGDSDTYSVFADVFNPIILEYHGLEVGFSHISDLDIEKVDGTINPDAPVLSTRYNFKIWKVKKIILKGQLRLELLKYIVFICRDQPI